MAKRDVRVLRALVLKARRKKRGAFPSSLQRQLLSYAERRWAEGASTPVVAAETGVNRHTLAYWRAHQRTRTKLRAVRVVESENGPAGIIVHGPSGVRIEGLDLDGLAELLRRLS